MTTDTKYRALLVVDFMSTERVHELMISFLDFFSLFSLLILGFLLEFLLLSISYFWAHGLCIGLKFDV
jgi:hypothetical protein